jgi:MoxR-like ATPase
MIETVRLPAEAYRSNAAISYSDINGLHDLFDKIAFKSNLIVVGPKGVAKTMACAAWAAKHEVPLVTFDCSEDVRRGHLYGHYITKGDDTPYVLGPITTAFEIANEVGHCILALEEINALTPQMQKILNSLADWRKKIELPEVGRVFELEGDAKLWVYGTMNTSVYGGVYDLNEDLKSRFRMINIGYPTEEQEKKIVSDLFPKWNIPAIKVGAQSLSIIEGVLTLARETRQQSMEYALSTRDVVQILEDTQAAGLNNALWMCMGKFEGQDRMTLYERMKSVFGAKVLGDKAPKKSTTGV